MDKTLGTGAQRWPPARTTMQGPLGLRTGTLSPAGRPLARRGSARGWGWEGYLRITVVEIGGQEAVREVTFDEAGRRQLLQTVSQRSAQRTRSHSPTSGPVLTVRTNSAPDTPLP